MHDTSLVGHEVGAGHPLDVLGGDGPNRLEAFVERADPTEDCVIVGNPGGQCVAGVEAVNEADLEAPLCLFELLCVYRIPSELR